MSRSFARQTFTALKKVGSPPHPQMTGQTAYRKIQSFLEILALIADRLKGNQRDGTIDFILDNWRLLWPWARFLIEHYILTDESANSVQDWHMHGLIQEESCRLIPSLIIERLPDSDSHKQHSSPRLQMLLTRVWLKFVENDHKDCASWTTMLSIATWLEISWTEGDLLRIEEIAAPLNTEEARYKTTMTFIRHLHRQISKLKELKDNDYRDLQLYYNTIMIGFGKEFLLAPSVRQHTLPAFTALFSALTRKRGSLHRLFVVTHKDYPSIYGFATDLMREISEMMSDSPRWVTMALETGLIEAMFRIDNSFLLWEGLGEVLIQTLTAHMTAAMDALDRFLLFPSVLHQFIRSYSKVEKMGLEDLMSDELRRQEWYSKAWMRIVHLALSYKYIERGARDKGFPGMCANDKKCPLLQPNDGANPTRRPYLRCGGCLAVVYCSRECRKVHWKEKHRSECSELARAFREGALPLTSQDKCFFRHFMNGYIAPSVEEIVQTVSAPQDQSQSGSPPQHSSPSTRLPIILMHFYRPGRDAIRGHVELIQPSHLAKWVSGVELDEFVSLWVSESQKDGEKRFFGVGLFDGAGRSIYPVISLPPGRSPNPIV
ncbi:hypothetical protein AAF712_010085 [Marasmius tenuissimus]|uniref:MYND-type domain-containing protein n=1 Tax=Marasmius tenuissimus TaxID=585030 RepID=A0ABR2ZPX2_9AGAR